MEQKQPKGNFFLIPTPIEGSLLLSLPQQVIETIHKTFYFIAEKARTTRRFIKTTNPPYAIQDIEVLEIEREVTALSIQNQMAPLLEGINVAFMSEAGLPCVADPGQKYVAFCHENNIKVIPFVGPSSIMLALMASGMNGQNFSFHGYLPAKRNALSDALKRLEREAQKNKQTQIFIEAPYRNNQVVEEALKVLNDRTRFCIALNLTTEEEWIYSQPILTWKKESLPNIHKQPAIFLLAP